MHVDAGANAARRYGYRGELRGETTVIVGPQGSTYTSWADALQAVSTQWTYKPLQKTVRLGVMRRVVDALKEGSMWEEAEAEWELQRKLHYEKEAAEARAADAKARLLQQQADAAKAELGDEALRKQIAAGEFAPLREWLREKVHKTGSVLASPDELLTSVTGGGVSPQPFLTYLRAKYSELYGLEL